MTPGGRLGHDPGQARARLRGDKFLAVSRPQRVEPTDPLVLPTREGYDRWAEVYDGDGNPLISGQICPLHPRFLDLAAKLLHDMAPYCTAGKVHVGLDESRVPESVRDLVGGGRRVAG